MLRSYRKMQEKGNSLASAMVMIMARYRLFVMLCLPFAAGPEEERRYVSAVDHLRTSSELRYQT